jgi:hypothetical protein
MNPQWICIQCPDDRIFMAQASTTCLASSILVQMKKKYRTLHCQFDCGVYKSCWIQTNWSLRSDLAQVRSGEFTYYRHILRRRYFVTMNGNSWLNRSINVVNISYICPQINNNNLFSDSVDRGGIQHSLIPASNLPPCCWPFPNQYGGTYRVWWMSRTKSSYSGGEKLFPRRTNRHCL